MFFQRQLEIYHIGNHIKLSWNIAKSLQTGQGSSNHICALACTALVEFALHIPKTHLGPTHYTRNQIPKSFVQVSIEPRKTNSGPKRQVHAPKESRRQVRIYPFTFPYTSLYISVPCFLMFSCGASSGPEKGLRAPNRALKRAFRPRKVPKDQFRIAQVQVPKNNFGIVRIWFNYIIYILHRHIDIYIYVNKYIYI